MKTLLCLAVALIPLAPFHAAESLNSALQKGLFEEEGNQNLEAAIVAYQSLIAAHDQDRKLAATAVFRLGECYRKLGRTNDAIAQYQRVLGAYSDQTTLATLSRQNLTGLGATVSAPGATSAPGASSSREALLQDLAAQESDSANLASMLSRLKSLARPELRKTLPTVSPDTLLTRLLESASQLEQKIAGLSTSFTKEHPSVREQSAALDVVNRQIDERIDGILRGLEVRAESAQRQVEVLKARLAALDSSRSPGSAPLDTASRAKMKSMLQEELQLAETLLAEQRKKVEVGVLAPGEEVRHERDVLGLRRQLLAVDGLSSNEARKQWRDWLVREVELGEQAARNEKRKLDVGRSTSAEVAQLQRDVLVSKRELLEFDARPAVATAGTSSASMTSEEEEEILKIRALIRNSPDLINAPSANSTPLHSAAAKGQLVVARFLLDNGAEVDRRTNDGKTALALACEQGHRAMAELLLSRGANPNSTDSSTETPLHVAAKKGFVSVAEVLLKNKASLEARNKSGGTPLLSAVAAGQTTSAEFLLKAGAEVNAKANDGSTPLHAAAGRLNNELVALLLKNGADVNAKDQNGMTPLWQVMNQLRTPQTQVPDPIATVRMLLEKGAKADGEIGGTTLTHHAVAGNFVETLHLFLEHGAPADRKNGDGVTPLQFAVAESRNPAMIPLLVKAGADVNALIYPNYNIRISNKNRFGRNDLQNVASYPPLIVAIWKGDLEATDALLTAGADVNSKDLQGNTALMYAGDQAPPMLDLVLRHKPDVNAANTNHKWTALHKATGQNSLSTVEALLKAGARVDPVNGDGHTPLHLAAMNGNPGVAELLLKAGANPNFFKPDGSLPLDFVSPGRPVPSGGKPAEVRQLLLQHGADESLLRRRSIVVTRRSAGYEEELFKRGTNEFNRFSLYELVARLYSHGGQNPPGRQFPDLRQISIERLADGGATRQLLVDLEARAAGESCTNDLWLEWGDRIEIREQEHPLNATWPGLEGTLATNISRCISRSVDLILKGRTNRIDLRATAMQSGTTIGGSGASRAVVTGFRIAQPFCGLVSVLRNSGLLLTSSDLSRVRVTRRDPETGKAREWILDETTVYHLHDFWLREGDVIEVPELDPATVRDNQATGGDIRPSTPGVGGFRSIPARELRPPAQAAPGQPLPGRPPAVPLPPPR